MNRSIPADTFFGATLVAAVLGSAALAPPAAAQDAAAPAQSVAESQLALGTPSDTDASQPELGHEDVPVMGVPVPEAELAGLRQTLEAFENAETDAAETGFYDWDLDGNGRRSYREWWLGELHRLGALDLYGVSAQLPQGYLKFKWDYGWLGANARFDSHGNRGPVFNPLIFEIAGEEQINVDLDLSGSGNGHTFQVSYGIIDPLDWYIEIPFTAMNLNLNPRVNPVDAEGNRIGEFAAGALGIEDRMAYDEEAFLYETFPALGRPAPAVGYDGRWLLGDINTGFSWNIFRSHRFSSAWTNRVFFPTGVVPAPESSITYATGPQPEIGIGGWGLSTTSGYDLRVAQFAPWVDVIASTEIGFGYFFKQQRPYPTNFTEPSALAGQIDAESFPDLSHLDGEFDYTPGFSMSWTAQLGVQLAIVGLNVGYGWAHSQKPELEGDAAFVSMVEGLELLGAQSRNEFQVGASLTLLPFYIPAQLGIARRFMIDGRDTLAFDNFWQFTFETVAPLHMLWNREAREPPRAPDRASTNAADHGSTYQ